MSTKQRCVHRSKPCCQTLKHINNVFATGGNNIVEVFESLTTSFWTMYTPLFSGHVGAFDTHLMLSLLYISNAISKNLPSRHFYKSTETMLQQQVMFLFYLVNIYISFIVFQFCAFYYYFCIVLEALFSFLIKIILQKRWPCTVLETYFMEWLLLYVLSQQSRMHILKNQCLIS